MDKPENKKQPSFIALLPFIIFVASYLFMGVYLIRSGDAMGFYSFKAPIACIIGIICAFILIKGSIDEKFNIFVKGCGDENIITMCIIYILAGAFSVVSKSMGGVDSVVNLGLSIIPPSLITVGIFIIACFISISTGTSVGTITALGPIAIGFADKTAISMPFILGALVGGAMFGDNLSVISDTTIAATKTQGVEMREKFRTNLAMCIPAVIVTAILLVVFGRTKSVTLADDLSYDIVKVIPYLFVLISAIAGMNVFVVLVLGSVLSGIIGMAYGSFGFIEFTNLCFDGFSGMFEIFLLSMLTGGLAALCSFGGGLDWLLTKIKGFIKSKKSAEVGIAAITTLTDFATANNTVAIIIDGPIARDISEEYQVDPRRTASLLDCFGSVGQGFIPYGAQILIAAGFTEGAVSPVEIMPYLWYQYLLAFFAILSIFIPYANGYINKHPWDFEKWMPKEKVNA